MGLNAIDKLICGDCLQQFSSIPDASVDVCFADPPFNLGKNYNKVDDQMRFGDYLAWCECWLKEMVRVTKPSGSIFVHNIPKWLTYYAACLNGIARFKHWISWDASTSPMGKTLQPAHYGILCYAKDYKAQKFFEIRYPHRRCRVCNYLHKDYGGKKKLLHPFGPLVSDVWTDIHRIRHKKFRDEHPCQLPVHLLERIILMSTDEGDLVLDPFLGTGTTAVAARRLGRRVIGFDIDEQYVRIAAERVANQGPSKIGSIWISKFANEIITIRDVDWPALRKHYVLPVSPERIDSCPILLRESHGRVRYGADLMSSNDGSGNKQEVLEFMADLEKIARNR